ncbi:MAG: glycerol-3-phosphate 1-O-acyltransferase PlsY [Clostridia bacterium]|nr:glycerol-3-phosphate 1-O-acyltransferase PlsY [Clostridia bacterium]
MTWWHYALVGLAAYFIGTFPSAVLITRLHDKDIDIRKVGSGNPGGTNVMRAMGARWGVLVMLLDAAKGALAAGLGWFLGLIFDVDQTASIICLCIASMAVITGHNWPVFSKFKGGKGIAASLGVVLVMSWPAGLIGLAAHQAILWPSGIMSLAGLMGTTVAVMVVMIFKHNDPMFAWYVIAGLFVWGSSIVTHRGNIKRIVNGTEKKVFKKK